MICKIMSLIFPGEREKLVVGFFTLRVTLEKCMLAFRYFDCIPVRQAALAWLFEAGVEGGMVWRHAFPLRRPTRAFIFLARVDRSMP